MGDALKIGSTAAFDFIALNAICLESNDADTCASDAANPDPGAAFFYLIRAGTACGEGTIGNGSAGPRTGRSCP